MGPATWQQVKKLFDLAIGLPPAMQDPFVRENAPADSAVLMETLRLLELEGRPGSPIDKLAAPLQIGFDRNGGIRALIPGRTLAGRYRIVRFLAAGGMGEVYEAEDLERGERIALKTLRAPFNTPDHAARLRREVEAARQVRHPNVCRVDALVQVDSLVFLTMELLEGETLGALLAREGPFGERRALPFLRQMAAGLSAAHAAGVVHRDLKPGNVMIVPRPGSTPRVVITDFGIAAQPSKDRRTTMAASPSTMAAFGTPAYMAPEQITDRTATSRADIYSFGVVMHEMLTGELPFADDSPLAMAVRKTTGRPASPELLAPGLRPAWVKIMMRCLEAVPSKRYSRIEHAMEGLESRSILGLRWKMLQRSIKKAPPRVLAGSGVAALVLLVGGYLWSAWPISIGKQQRDWDQAIYTLQAGEPMEAAKRMERISGGRRLTAREQSWVALAWFEAGFPERARRELDRTSNLLTTQADQQFVAMAGFVIAGKPSEGVDLLRQEVDSAPRDHQALGALAWLQSKRKSPDAIALWERLATLQPDNPAAAFRLAEAAASQDNTKDALRSFLLAQTYFDAAGNKEMSRIVAGRRGVFLIRSGNWAAAGEDLAGLHAPGRARCEHTLTLMAGADDHFATPNDPIPYLSPRFRLLPQSARQLAFDDRSHPEGEMRVLEGELRLSFPLPPVQFCSGVLEMRIRKMQNDAGPMNDMVTVGVAPFEPSGAPERYSLWAARSEATERVAAFDLSAALLATPQRSYAGEGVVSLDIQAADDTIFDYVKLILVY